MGEQSISSLPVMDNTIPLIVPLWTMAHPADFFNGKFLYYREIGLEDPTTLRRVAERIAEANPNMTDFNPDQAIIATWLLEPVHVVRFTLLCTYLPPLHSSIYS